VHAGFLSDAAMTATQDAARQREARLSAELAETKAALQAIRRSRTWRMLRVLHGFIDERPWLRRWLRRGFDLVRIGVRRGSLRQGVAEADIQAVLGSGLFDPEWYAARYPGVSGDPLAVARAYLDHVGATPRDPGPGFDAAWYIASNPDAGDGNALLHYLRKGRHRLRPPGPAAQQEIARARRQALGLDLEVPQIRLAVGLAGPTTQDALARVVRSAALAAETAGLDTGWDILWLAQPGIAAPGTVRRVAAPADTGLATSHNLLLREATASGALLYLAADAGGMFHPGCIAALLRMSAAAGHKALIGATDFPQENPKAYDPCSFDTGWAGGACLLIPLELATDIGGFEPGFGRYWDVDLSWRARQAGYAVKTCPPALYHVGPTVWASHTAGASQTAGVSQTGVSQTGVSQTGVSQTGVSETGVSQARASQAAGVPQDRLDLDALGAGLALAMLWDHRPAAAAIRAEILRRDGRLPDLPPDRAMAANRWRDPAIADFDHGFGFAPSRW
jgi:hypothetical protein